MEDIDGGLHPAVDGQSLDEMRCVWVGRGREGGGWGGGGVPFSGGITKPSNHFTYFDV